MNTLHRNLIDNAFLGMSKDIDDQFYWTDGTPLDYDSWGPGGCKIYQVKNSKNIFKIPFLYSCRAQQLSWIRKLLHDEFGVRPLE